MEVEKIEEKERKRQKKEKRIGTFNNHGKRHKVSCGTLFGTLRPPSTTTL
jgi:hypothetical protein